MQQAIIFDTHAFVKRLVSVGMSESQAEVLAESQAELINEKFVTREYFDLRMKELDLKIEHVKSELIIKLGSMMVVSIGVVATLVKLL